jgi:hypothetical protein
MEHLTFKVIEVTDASEFTDHKERITLRVMDPDKKGISGRIQMVNELELYVGDQIVYTSSGEFQKRSERNELAADNPLKSYDRMKAEDEATEREVSRG